MDSDIENISRTCEQCFTNQPEASKGIISPWPASSKVFQRIHMDFLELKGQHFLIISDSFSKWVEVYIMHTTSAAETVNKLRDCFARFGLPDCIVSDNGPQFSSREFTTFCNKNGIKFLTSPPYKPQSNGAAENAVKTFKNSLKRALEDPQNNGISFQTLISRHLFFYRSCIHCTTGKYNIYTPHKLMFGREMRAHFDQLQPNYFKTISTEIDKQTNKINSTRKLKKFNVGENILVRNYSKYGKKWIQATITKQLGINVFDCKTSNGTWKRHSDQIRKLSPEVLPFQEEEDETLDVFEFPNVDDSKNMPITTIQRPASSSVITRSGRESRPPIRYGQNKKSNY